jgi:hypothetical protein
MGAAVLPDLLVDVLAAHAADAQLRLDGLAVAVFSLAALHV